MTTSFCSKVCLIVLGLVLWPVSSRADTAATASPTATADTEAKVKAEAEAEANKACATDTKGNDIWSVVKSSPLNSVPVYVDWGSWGGSMSAAIRPPPLEPGDGGRGINYRIVVATAKKKQPSESVPAEPDVIDRTQIFAKTIPDDHPWVMPGRAAKGDILLTFQLPVGTWDWWQPWPSKIITIVGCQNKKMLFYASASTIFTSPRITWLLSFVGTLLAYIFVSKCVCGWEGIKNLRDNKLPRPKESEQTEKLKAERTNKLPHWYNYLDPVVLSSGPNGDGSISRLQILFFSFLVFFLLLYILLKVGQLSALSDTVLILMGISGIGAGLAKATEVGKERLSFENWAWLIDRKWLPENGLAATKVARWRDLVTSADGLDVYHVQMLIFSLVVGVSLFKNGVTATDLSSFEIPQSMLTLLGLSQAVYIGGKLVASPTIKDLDGALTNLRNFETDFIAAYITAAPTDANKAALKVALKATLTDADKDALTDALTVAIKAALTDAEKVALTDVDKAAREAALKVIVTNTG
jgi:hypothetical protein